MILPPGEPPPPGFHYVCTRCGACCQWEGYVRLSEEEVDTIAEFLGMAVEQFVARYTTVTADRRSLTLIERGDGACIMLTGENRCRINPVKPYQCQAFPNIWNFPGWQEECEAKLVPDDGKE
ncbi:MAG: YkgJ family cysteine cluster protein [Lentisphaeria bacterium]|jgi:Fe-S-cluster containining protein|nr:YkgJ family cysteine cluster protein [Lentisphaeria bacterium]